MTIIIKRSKYSGLSNTLQGGEDLDLKGGNLPHFILHGIVAVIVTLLEFMTLYPGWARSKEKEVGKWHGKVSKVLFVLRWGAFLSGEMSYLVYSTGRRKFIPGSAAWSPGNRGSTAQGRPPSSPGAG